MVESVRWLKSFVYVEVIVLSRTVAHFRKWADKELNNVKNASDIESMTADVERTCEQMPSSALSLSEVEWTMLRGLVVEAYLHSDRASEETEGCLFACPH